MSKHTAQLAEARAALTAAKNDLDTAIKQSTPKTV